MKYSVMKLSSKRIKNYYVCYVLVVHENKFVPYLLMKHFDSESDADFYFDYLCNYIQNETNEAIFNKCYLENFTSSHKDFMLW